MDRHSLTQEASSGSLGNVRACSGSAAAKSGLFPAQRQFFYLLRLVRRVCANCKEELEVPEQALIDAGYTPEEAKTTKIYHGKGCTTCNKGGYKGRTGLYEVMEINDELRELILVGASALELKKKAIEQGMITLRRSVLVKVASGMTTMEEVLRETVL